MSEKQSPFEVVPFTEEQRAVLKWYDGDGYLDCVYIGLRGGPKFAVTSTFLEEAENLYYIPIQPTDIFVDTFPRSGTTWTQELVWLLMNNLDFAKAKSIPLTERYYFFEQFTLMGSLAKDMLPAVKDDPEKMKILERQTKPAGEVMANIPSPRFIKSHLPVSLLPKGALESAKTIYVARDPRDVAVSWYHFRREFTALYMDVDFKIFYYELFVNNLLPWTPYMEHVKEAWSLRHHPNLLFIFYEELSKDLKGTCARVSEFLGKQYSDQQLDQLADHLTFDKFQKNSAVDLQDMKNLGLMHNKENNFIRKGKAGGWREYFDEDMSAHASKWIEEQLRDSDLRFPQTQ